MAGKRITKDENESRVTKCYFFRFEDPHPFGIKDWLVWCHDTYGDKSEQTYTKYWADAGNLYQDGWREKLNKQLDPAVNELIRLLADENPKIRHEAAKSIFKYTGHEVQKIEADIKTDIKIKFG